MFLSTSKLTQFCSYSFTPGSPRPALSLTGEAVSPAALLAVVPDTTAPDPFAVGTVYPFGNSTFSPSYADVVDFLLEGEPVRFAVRLDGYCTRIGTPEDTTEGYCHFTYTVDDPRSLSNIGTFVAEGPVTNPNMMSSNPCGGLQVTGGTGIFTASSGLVAFCPSIFNDDFTPPLIESLPAGRDVFEDADGYLHLIDMDLDEEFVFESN